jgi:hypothetical protein
MVILKKIRLGSNICLIAAGFEGVEYGDLRT